MAHLGEQLVAACLAPFPDSKGPVVLRGKVLVRPPRNNDLKAIVIRDSVSPSHSNVVKNGTSNDGFFGILVVASKIAKTGESLLENAEEVFAHLCSQSRQTAVEICLPAIKCFIKLITNTELLFLSFIINNKKYKLTHYTGNKLK